MRQSSGDFKKRSDSGRGGRSFSRGRNNDGPDSRRGGRDSSSGRGGRSSADSVDWKPRKKSEESSSGDSERKPRFGAESNSFSRNNDGFERKPRFSRDDDREGGFKPRFNSDSDGNRNSSFDRKPHFSKSFDSDKSYERKPRFGGDVDDDNDGDFDPSSSSTPRVDDERAERRPRFLRTKPDSQEGDAESRPRFNRSSEGSDSSDRKPRFSRDKSGDEGFERKPRFDSDSDRDGGYERKPRFNSDRDGGFDRKPRFNRDSDRDGGYKPRFDRDSDRGDRSSWKPRSSGNTYGEGGERKRIDLKFKPKPTYQVNAPDRVQKVDDGTIRLNKFISTAGICSRREADELIQEGKVKVNGQVVTVLGTKVLPTDTITYKGKTLIPEKKVYILMNKPKDCVTTKDDPEARRTVFDMLQGACTEQLHAVGRLDRNTTGVLLLTNDGEMTQKLTHPKFNKSKIYHVWLDRNITDADLQQISRGVELEDGFVKPDDVSFVEPGDKTQIGIEIHSGQNRVVRRIFEHFEYKVQKLDRVFFAGLTKKALPRGEWRYLTDEEVSILKRISIK